MSSASSIPARPALPAATDDAPQIGAPDRLFGLYVVLTGAVFLLLPGRPPTWPGLVLLHCVLAWFALGGPGALRLRRAVARAAPRPARFLFAWYPLILIPLLYSELDVLNIAVHGGRMFDPLIIDIEQVLFRGQPSRDWAAAMPWLALSEPLHVAYLSYYVILYFPALAIWLRRTRTEFAQAMFTILLGFLAHYVIFIFFPVEGPRYRFPAPSGGIENGPFYQLAHRLLEAGSSRGAAFPSSHVGASVAIAIATLRTLPRTGVALLLVTFGVGLGAVYGGFHYATDAVAGWILGTAVALIAPALERRFARSRTGA